jgi:hypothetical protein
MRCGYCPQSRIAAAYSGPALMTPVTCGVCLRHCPPATTVAFAGFAEPYGNPQATVMIRYAAETGSAVQVFTTAAGMTDADADALLALRPNWVVLHLPDAAGVMRLAVSVAYVARVRRLIAGLPAVRTICFGDVHPAFAGHGGQVLPSMAHSRAGNVGHGPPAMLGALRCTAAPALDHPVLLPDGRLVLCCQDYGLEHVMGNLLENDWAGIRSGPAYAALERAMASRDGDCLCRHCEMARPV